MSIENQIHGFPQLSYVQSRTGRTVNAGTAIGVATAASQLATQRPPQRVRVDNQRTLLTGGERSRRRDVGEELHSLGDLETGAHSRPMS